MSALGERLRRAIPMPEMDEGELRTRAREAYCDTHKPPRWLARRVRAGKHDRLLRVVMHALRDLNRPVQAIVAERDEGTVALILSTAPGIPRDEATAAALLTAVRMGRRG
jgi:hypothetical protein